MSREAWGDEGNVATHWEETLMATELEKVSDHFLRWRKDHFDSLPGEDAQGVVNEIVWAFDVLQRALTGKIDG